MIYLQEAFGVAAAAIVIIFGFAFFMKVLGFMLSGGGTPVLMGVVIGVAIWRLKKG